MPKQTKKKITDVKSTVDYSRELPNKAKPEKKRGAKSQYANKVLPYLRIATARRVSCFGAFL